MSRYFGSPGAATPVVFSLGVLGFWNDIATPRAAYYNGKTYLAFIRDTGHVYAAQFVHSTRTLSTAVDLATTTSPDGVIHNSPAILVRDSDHKIIPVASEDSASAQPAYWISTSAEDATAFGSTQLIAPSLAYPTYPTIVQLASVTNSPIYYFVRRNDSGTYHVGYYKSTDGGSTWASWVSLLKPNTTTSQYFRIGSNATRIDIFTTNTNRVDSPSSVYHLYLDGATDNLYQTDGTLIGAAGSGPYFATAGTLVKSATEGSARAEGWAYSSGNPACLVMCNTGSTNLVRCARWTGTLWQVDNVTDTNGYIGTNAYISSGAMVKTDPNTLYIPKKVGSRFEMYRYVSADSGATWTGTAITSGSSLDNAMPDTPLNAATGLQLVWGLGSYTNDSTFSFTMQGYGTS